MPEVVGHRLDVALGEISEAGFDDEVDIAGGGTFGVIDESNWVVCGQSPRAGAEFSDAVELTVDRSCDDASSETAAPSTEPLPEATLPPATEPPTPTTRESTIAEPATTAVPGSSVVVPDERITVETNAEFAALLLEPDYCSATVQAFASTYRNRVIEFDGHIAAMNNHGDYDTRYDILVGPGDFSESSVSGPAFQFRDVSIFDLNLMGENIPEFVGPMDRLHVVAEVGDYESTTCLFLIDPVETSLR